MLTIVTLNNNELKIVLVKSLGSVLIQGPSGLIEALPEPLSAGLVCPVSSSRPQQGEKAVLCVILLALVSHRLVWTSFMQGRVLPMMRSAEQTTLCRALGSCSMLFPYQTVMFPVRTLSMVQEYKFLSIWGDTRNFLKHLRWNGLLLAFLKAESVCSAQVRPSVMWTPRCLKLSTLSTVDLLMLRGA